MQVEVVVEMVDMVALVVVVGVAAAVVDVEVMDAVIVVVMVVEVHGVLLAIMSGVNGLSNGMIIKIGSLIRMFPEIDTWMKEAVAVTHQEDLAPKIEAVVIVVAIVEVAVGAGEGVVAIVGVGAAAAAVVTVMTGVVMITIEDLPIGKEAHERVNCRGQNLQDLQPVTVLQINIGKLLMPKIANSRLFLRIATYLI